MLTERELHAQLLALAVRLDADPSYVGAADVVREAADLIASEWNVT